MRKRLFIAMLIVTVGLVSGAQAQVGSYQDFILIQDNDRQCWTFTSGYDHAYLVLYRMSCANGVAGWECRLDASGDAFITSVTHDLGIDADSDALGFAVGLAEVLPYSDYCILADIEYASFGAPGALYVYPNRTPSLPGTAVYVDGADPLNVIPMSHIPLATGWEDASFAVNWMVPTDESSWGEVKALYR